jgi:c-di-GMP-binding flagellar brake protein YcgR
MYTLVRVRPRGDGKYCWTGYIYDISSTGMRFELDSAIEAGAEIEIRAMLPGFPHTTFNATGHVVRRHDDLEERGPIRMGMVFDRFANTNDRRKLEDYLVNQSGRMAA